MASAAVADPKMLFTTTVS